MKTGALPSGSFNTWEDSRIWMSKSSKSIQNTVQVTVTIKTNGTHFSVRRSNKYLLQGSLIPSCNLSSSTMSQVEIGAQ